MTQKKLSPQSKQRNQCRLARNTLSEQQQLTHAKKATEKLLLSDLLKNATKIALFISQDGELSTKQLIKSLWLQNKQLYLPKILDRQTIQFYQYRLDSKMYLNKFNILEPENDHFINVKTLDAIIMPLTCFDDLGNRIGMGGGFYDHLLQFKQKTTVSKPLLIGWAHQCQQTKTIKSNDWDIPLDALITETNLYRFKHF